MGNKLTIESLKLKGKSEKPPKAGLAGKRVAGDDERRGKEKDNAEALRTQRFRREGRLEEEDAGSGRGRVSKREAGSGWKPKFTEYGTASLMTCQVIYYVVMIRMACAWRVSW